MKRTKLIITAVLLLFFALISFGQSDKKKNKTQAPASTEGGKCFNESTKVLNIGIGFFGGNYYSYRGSGAYVYRTSPAFSISYEQALSKKVGPGYLGLGGYLG